MSNIPTFKQYLVEEQREVFFTFGRMNPPTIGHGKLMNVLSTKSGKNPYKIYLTHSQDARKNPLTYDQKIKHSRKMFPKHSRNIISDKKLKSVFDVVTSLYDQGYNRVTMVVGADRTAEFKTLLEKYNGTKARHGFYNFERINIVSAGDRDPDAEGVEGMSASKQRENVKRNDFTTFGQGVPSSMSNQDAKRLFNDLRLGMGLKETTQFKNKVYLQPVSDIREKYITGDLFNEGDRVIITSSKKEGVVHRLGANHVIVALDEGRISRQWLQNIELVEKEIEKYDTDKHQWGTDEAEKRAMDITPDAKKKLPVKEDEISDVRNQIARDDKKDSESRKIKNDRLLDRARLIRTRRKNRETK